MSEVYRQQRVATWPSPHFTKKTSSLPVNQSLEHLGIEGDSPTYQKWRLDHGVPISDIGDPAKRTDEPQLVDQAPKTLMAFSENNIGNGSEQHASGTSDVLRLSKEAFVRKAAIEAGKYWDEMHARDTTAFG
ncbi:uncharacterized protein FTJAE_12522 [Fusarium tjaetaba]|uniref:Uncharacterized protein n=1 Tax=Fusarium tjaetaba TaxID=1567544 RepID=A0A8H5VAY3_9HYPO|nr:uncharacterized protein FTJAE_12522 [Fusarium tjaetaba]KAF5617732.1 hypothetical protein FTJAE_12522 [Fusarium tjaetaba]